MKLISITVLTLIVCVSIIGGVIWGCGTFERASREDARERTEKARKEAAVLEYELQKEQQEKAAESVNAQERAKFEKETWELVREGEMSPEFARKLLGVPLTYGEAQYIVNRQEQERKERLNQSYKQR